MEDSIQQYIKAAEDLRNLIREGHELLKDLRAENTMTRKLIKQYETEAVNAAKARVSTIEEELWTKFREDAFKNFSGALDKAVNIITEAVDKHVLFIAGQAETLALAMDRQNSEAVRAVGLIARDTYGARRKRRKQA